MLSIFDEFTVKQAVFVSEEQFDEGSTLDIIEKNGFIKYNIKDRKYYFHTIFKNFLKNEFSKQENVFKKKIYDAAGRWYSDNDNNFMAVSFFIKNGDYKSVLSLDWTRQHFFENVTRSNKEIFMDIITKTPNAIKKKYPKNYLLFIFSLFLFNERNYFKSECELLKEFIENNGDMGRFEKNQILGECCFIEALNYYSDVKEMNEYYINAFKLISSPTKLFRGYNLFCFQTPSVLGTFHREVGKVEDEINILNDAMPNYYKLTEGNCKGVENLMKAEALYNQGNLKDALLLCEKAEYMAESRNQIYVKIITLFLEGRIELMKGNYDGISSCVKEMDKLLTDDLEHSNKKLIDMCKGFLSISYDNTDNISGWLLDSTQIEVNTSIVTLGFANLIYGRSLIISEEYDRLLAISGQMLKLTGIFSNIMYKIYTYIYIAVAKYHTSEYEKSAEILAEAIMLAYPDELIMPFVESGDEILNILEKFKNSLCTDEIEYFIEKLKKAIKKYIKSIKEVKKASFDNHSYGLTKRELEVAKLAAKRMSNKEIADILFIAESTVKSNLKIIFNKLSINSRSELKDYFYD